jgi:prolyl oligopeptidase
MPEKTQWDPSATPYPKAKRLDHVDVYKSQNRGEVKIEDPYRWLEVPPSESKETEVGAYTLLEVKD